jgi:hypothetical protein
MQIGLEQKFLLVNTKFTNLAGGLLVKSRAYGVLICQKC